MSMFNPRIFDAHSDIPMQVVRERKKRGRNNVIQDDFLGGMRDSQIKSRFLAVYITNDYVPEMSVSRAMEIMVETRKDIQESSELKLCNSISEVRENVDDYYTFLFSMEGAEPLLNNISLLDGYYNLGLRSLILTHSRRNMVGDGAPIRKGQKKTTGGLSDFGRDVVDRCVDLGILLDLSHINEEGFWDVLDRTNETVIASHSNSSEVYDTPRNLSNAQLKAIAERGGTIGLVSGVSKFVKNGTPTIEDFMDHLNHVVNVVGVEHVGFGFDYFEYVKKYYWNNRFKDSKFGVVGMSDDSEVYNIVDKMKQEGYTEDEIEKICSSNFEESISRVID